VNRFSQSCRIACEPPLPIVFADENGWVCHKLRRIYRLERAPMEGRDAKDLEIVLGNDRKPWRSPNCPR
jgi:hypothetical protein